MSPHAVTPVLRSPELSACRDWRPVSSSSTPPRTVKRNVAASAFSKASTDLSNPRSVSPAPCDTDAINHPLWRTQRALQSGFSSMMASLAMLPTPFTSNPNPVQHTSSSRSSLATGLPATTSRSAACVAHPIGLEPDLVLSPAPAPTHSSTSLPEVFHGLTLGSLKWQETEADPKAELYGEMDVEGDRVADEAPTTLEPFLRRANYLEVQYTSFLAELANMAYEVWKLDPEVLDEHHNLQLVCTSASCPLGPDSFSLREQHKAQVAASTRNNAGFYDEGVKELCSDSVSGDTSGGSYDDDGYFHEEVVLQQQQTLCQTQAEQVPGWPENDQAGSSASDGTETVLVGLDPEHQNLSTLMALSMNSVHINPDVSRLAMALSAQDITLPIIPMALPTQFADHPEKFAKEIHCFVMSIKQGKQYKFTESSASAGAALPEPRSDLFKSAGTHAEGSTSSTPNSLGGEVSRRSSSIPVENSAACCGGPASHDLVTNTACDTFASSLTMAHVPVDIPADNDAAATSTADGATLLGATRTDHRATQEANKPFSVNPDPVTDWFVCDDPISKTRYFCIKGSDSLEHWQINCKFDPVTFEKSSLGVRIHSGVYEAALRLYDDLVPLVRKHVSSSAEANVCFLGHSLGGSLSSVIMLMLVLRGELPPSALSPSYTFGAPAVFCGGAVDAALEGTYMDSEHASSSAGAAADSVLKWEAMCMDEWQSMRHAGLLTRLGLNEDQLVNVIMHKDICPRVFVCDYTIVADLLKTWMPSFKEHSMLQDSHQHKLLYNFIGRVAILRPDDEAPFVENDADHSMLPSIPGLYKMYDPRDLGVSELAPSGSSSLLQLPEDSTMWVARGVQHVSKEHSQLLGMQSAQATLPAQLTREAKPSGRGVVLACGTQPRQPEACSDGAAPTAPLSTSPVTPSELDVIEADALEVHALSRSFTISPGGECVSSSGPPSLREVPGLGPLTTGGGRQARMCDAVLKFMNEPHPLAMLIDPGSYGHGGAISRYHDPKNYTTGLLRVARLKAAGLQSLSLP